MKTNLDTINESTATPMMQQYLAVKKQHKDYLLMYRMGDFYELFFDDAEIASSALDISLTARGKGSALEVPMCGVPFHSVDGYIQKLIKSGYKVAICDQLESPEEAKKRGYKAIVRRDVTRIITAGTVTEDSLLDSKNSNYLAAIVKAENKLAFAWVDISTAEFSVIATSLDRIATDLAVLSPKEILISDKLAAEDAFRDILFSYKRSLTTQVSSFFDYSRAEKNLKDFYKIKEIDVISRLNKAALAACGALIEYISLTQKTTTELPYPTLIESSNFMIIDSSTRRNLELNYTLEGAKKGSLLSLMDKTITSTGARAFYNYFSLPLIDAEQINERLNKIEYFLENKELTERLRETFKLFPDIERALSRLGFNRSGPRDMLLIRNGLLAALKVAEIIDHTENLPEFLVNYSTKLGGFDRLISELSNSIEDECPMLARDGGFIRPNYNAQLDSLRNIGANIDVEVEKLRDKYRHATQIPNLKITNNNVIGYFIEVTAGNASKMGSTDFIHRQTLANCARYTTLELKALETTLVNSAENILRIELQIFEEIRTLILAASERILNLCKSIAELDIFSSLSILASNNNYTKPIVDNSSNLEIKGGRHPIVEVAIKKDGNQFTANNCTMDISNKAWLITGPNMAGKSTFLRQNALIIFMAQIGSFVPAEFARIGIVDRLFSRIGASDDLASGRSTFMVEMVETATILNQSSERSFVILDEIGRGTSTYDGLAIAWSCLEYLHNRLKVKTLFATHYHELTCLSSKLKSLKCYNMKVKEHNGDVIFLHEVAEGAADGSYGIHVAKLAGLPKEVIKRAEEVLEMIETVNDGNGLFNKSGQLSLFGSAKIEKPKQEAKPSPLEELIKNLNPDEFTPKSALEFLYKIKEDA